MSRVYQGENEARRVSLKETDQIEIEKEKNVVCSEISHQTLVTEAEDKSVN